MKIFLYLSFCLLFVTTAFAQGDYDHERRGYEEERRHDPRHYRERYVCIKSSYSAFTSGKWSPMRLSDNEVLKLRFLSKEDCRTSITQRYRKKVCVPSQRQRGKYYLFDLQKNETFGLNNSYGLFGNSNYFENVSDCDIALHSSSNKFTCLPSNRHRGKFYLYSQQQQTNVMPDQYFDNVNQCALTMRHRRRNFLCAPSGRYPGQYYYHDLRSNTKIGSYFKGQRQCIESMRKIRRKISCMASERFPGKLYMLNVEKNSALTSGNQISWASNTIYFDESSTCNESLMSANNKYLCMPSTRYLGNFYLFDYRNNQAGPRGYFDDLHDCKESLRPQYYYNDRHRRDRHIQGQRPSCQSNLRGRLPSRRKNLRKIMDVVEGNTGNQQQTNVGISPENKKKAKKALSKFLGEKRGEDAIYKIFAEADQNKSDSLDRRELKAFLAHIKLGNGLTRGNWADGILDAFGAYDKVKNNKILTRSAGQAMLESMDLY